MREHALARAPRLPLRRTRSPQQVVRSSLDVKLWTPTPAVSLVRPPQCPRCETASTPLGERVALHGHGLRERQFWGPLEPDGPPVLTVVRVRRFLCTGCGATVTVAPSEALTARLYTASAIAWALALYGLQKLAVAAIRKLVSPMLIVGATSAASWLTLRRWCRDVASSRLFCGVRRVVGTAREVAAAAASSLSAYALPTPEPPPLPVLAFHGAARAR